MEHPPASEKHHGSGNVHSNTHAGNSSMGPPSSVTNPNRRALAIGIILVSVILIVGVLVFTKLTQTNEPPIPVVQPVQIKLIVDSTCTFCPQTNTILAKLDESNIQYALSTIDLHSEEGQSLVKEFDLVYVPTALVSVAGLDQNTTIQGALQGQFINDPLQTKKGWVIIPEKFLDKQPKLLTYVKQPSTCVVPEGKALITAQLDYGDCKPCIEAQKILNGLTQKYDEVAVNYHPIMYNRFSFAEIQAAFTANKGAVCADQKGFLNAYTECNYFNAQFYGNLDINFMKACIKEAGANSKETQEEFVSCVQDENSGADQILIQNTKEGLAWNPLKYTPSFIIDCTYSFVGQNSLPLYLCGIHPELEGCEELIENTLNPPIIEVPIDTNASDANSSQGDFSLVIGDANTDSNALI